MLSSLLKTHDFKTDIGFLPYQLGINQGFDRDMFVFDWYCYLNIKDYIQGVTGGTDQTLGGCSLC